MAVGPTLAELHSLELCLGKTAALLSLPPSHRGMHASDLAVHPGKANEAHVGLFAFVNIYVQACLCADAHARHVSIYLLILFTKHLNDAHLVLCAQF